MFIQENIPLSAYSTMRLGGLARYFTEINHRDEMAEVHFWALKHNMPLIMIGGGSNIYWSDEGFGGLVVVNKILGFEIDSSLRPTAYIKIGAGEIWDTVVQRTVETGLTGLEFLSLIPGTSGATPIQNVGAYGQEIANLLVTVEAFDRQEGKLVNLMAADCQFSYRSSRFRTTDKNRFLISSITLQLTYGNPAPPFYSALSNYFSSQNIKKFTPSIVRQAVIALRNLKLPDPAIVANNGSFFKNPVVSVDLKEQIFANYNDLVYWAQDDGSVKLSAAWLIEKTGFKDYHDPETGFGTWPAQALVIINESSTKTADLTKFRDKIVIAVKNKFGVDLEQEPEQLG